MIAYFNAERNLTGKYIVSISGDMRDSYSVSWQIDGDTMIHHKYT